jgi:hypothetical protein
MHLILPIGQIFERGLDPLVVLSVKIKPFGQRRAGSDGNVSGGFAAELHRLSSIGQERG